MSPRPDQPRRGDGSRPRARTLPAHAHLRATGGAVRRRTGRRGSSTATVAATSTSSRAWPSRRWATRTPRSPRRMAAQANRLLHVSNLYGTEHNGPLATTLDRLVGGDGQVFFCNSGAEANEAALKLARKFGGRGRHVVVSAYGSFHGRTLATLHATGQPAKHEAFQPLPEGFRHVAWDDLEALEASLDPSVAAVLLEPVQGEGGVNPATAEYFRGVRELCDERGILFMVDEVQCGLGRTGEWFGFQHFGVRPDVVTMAKALGNGMPIGACWARADVAAAFEPGDHATTFGGQPLADRHRTRRRRDHGARGRAGSRPEGGGATHPTPRCDRRRRRGPRAGPVARDRARHRGHRVRRGDGGPAPPRRRCDRQCRHPDGVAARAQPADLRRRARPRRSASIGQGRSEGPSMRHFLEITDLEVAELDRVLELAELGRPAAGARAAAGESWPSRSRRRAPASRWRWRPRSWAAIP